MDTFLANNLINMPFQLVEKNNNDIWIAVNDVHNNDNYFLHKIL